MSSPRVVLGAPLYNHADHLPEAIESLLAQTYRDFVLLLIDDGSTDETLAMARRYAAADPRVELEVNPVRLGMLGNTNRAFTLPLERYPGAHYWALASDHDLWEPRWLETLVGLLDANTDAVLAYPLTRRIDEHGRPYERQKSPWRFESGVEPDLRRRLRRAFRSMAAGDMIYGLFRADALRRVGCYRPVLIPDRLLLSELALHGQFVQAPEVLWSRRFRGLAELDRQRRLFWPAGAPTYARLPWWLQHTGLVAYEYGIRAKGRELGLDQLAGFRLALDYLDVSLRHRAWRRWRRARKRVIESRDATLGPPVRALMRRPAARRFTLEHAVPALERTEAALDRLSRDDTDRS